MIHKKLISLLVLLMTAVTGAWAQNADNCPNVGQLHKRVAKAPRRVVANIPSEVISSFSCTSSYQYGVATDGEYIYISSWSTSSSSMFYKYDLDGNFIDEFNISDCGNCRDMTYDGTYFYGVANGSTIYQIDFENKMVVGTINIEGMSMRSVTYDEKRDGFWVTGNWTEPLALYDRNGNKIQEGIYAGSVSGIGYYEDYTGEEHILQFNNINNTVNDYNITTNTIQYDVFDLTTIPGRTDGTAGGCFIGEYKGKICMFADIQQSPNLIGIYQLPDANKYTFDLINDANDEAHGTFKFFKNNKEVIAAKEGDNVTMTISPDEGYVIGSVSASAYTTWAGARRKAPAAIPMLGNITLTPVEGKANTWTFTMPAANVEVSATYIPIAAITFNAANAYTIEAGKATVKVDGAAATVTEGKLQGVKMGSEVKMNAAQGYKFRKVEAKKKGAPKYADVVTICEKNGDNKYLVSSFFDGTNANITTITKEEAIALAEYLGGGNIRVVYEEYEFYDTRYVRATYAAGNVAGVLLSTTNTSNVPLYYIPAGN